MIITLTLNPALDLTYHLADDTLGAVDVHRSTSQTLEASGKGINVSRDLHAAGVATAAVFPSAGATGRHLAELLVAEGVRHAAPASSGETRINSTVLLPHGQTIKINGPGAALTPVDVGAVLDAVDQELTQAGGEEETWLVISGSLAPGAGPEVVTAFVELAHRHTARCAVDISGPALAAALAAGADLLAPNEIELADLLGVPKPTSVDETAALARRVAREYDAQLLVSMGKAGAIHTDGFSVIHGGGPELVPVNTAGAGDAFLAGWLAAAGTPSERMARAMQWGRSACLCPTTVDPRPGSAGTEGITVSQIETAERP